MNGVELDHADDLTPRADTQFDCSAKFEGPADHRSTREIKLQKCEIVLSLD